MAGARAMMRYRRTKPDGTVGGNTDMSNAAAGGAMSRGWGQPTSGAIRTTISAGGVVGTAAAGAVGGVPVLMTKDGVRAQSAQQQMQQPAGSMFKTQVAQTSSTPALSSSAAKKVL